MKPPRTSADFVRDMMEYAGKAERFLHNISLDEFKKNEQTAFAVIRALEVIGEAAKNIQASVRDRHPAVPWGRATAMRDKMMHGYFGVDLEVVWRTVKEDLPQLQKALLPVLEEMEREERKK